MFYYYNLFFDHTVENKNISVIWSIGNAILLISIFSETFRLPSWSKHIRSNVSNKLLSKSKMSKKKFLLINWWFSKRSDHRFRRTVRKRMWAQNKLTINSLCENNTRLKRLTLNIKMLVNLRIILGWLGWLNVYEQVKSYFEFWYDQFLFCETKKKKKFDYFLLRVKVLVLYTIFYPSMSCTEIEPKLT